jgi:transcriptional regulator with XRE-family HTH domain
MITMTTTDADPPATALLKEWTGRTGRSLSDVCAEVEISRSTLTRYLRGVHAPSVDTAFAIQKYTADFVKAEHWIRVGG